MTYGVFGVGHQTNIRQKAVRFQLILWERKVVAHGTSGGPGEFRGLYSLWGRKELDTTEGLSLHKWFLIRGS